MNTMHGIRSTTIILILLAVPALLLGAGREFVPAPAGGGDGIHLCPDDDAVTGVPGRAAPRAAAEETPPPATASRLGEIGGDDVIALATSLEAYSNSMDIASDGTIYAAIQVEGTYGDEILIRRSEDGGTTWSAVTTVRDLDPDIDLIEPCLEVGEGLADRWYLAYIAYDYFADRYVLNVVHADLATPSSVSAPVTIIDQAGLYPRRPHMTTDEASWNDYYIYLVADAGDTNQGAGSDIWFTRSNDQGTTFEAAYEIATLSTTDRGYRRPVVSYGYGGNVHVAWFFTSLTDAFDSALRYRRATSYANGGLSAWEGVQYLTTTSNGFWEKDPAVAASTAGNEVLIAYRRLEDDISVHVSAAVASADAGVTFGSEVLNSSGVWGGLELRYQAATDQFVLGGWRYGEMEIQRSPAASPTAFGTLLTLNDEAHWNYLGMHRPLSLALNPAEGDRAALLDTHNLHSAADTVYFDAEWRRDPGYPVTEEGFPVHIPYAPKSDPALADMDGDGDLEIVYCDEGDRIVVLRNDGSHLPGWPVLVPGVLSDGAVAVGDLNLDGSPTVAVGTGDGLVFAYTHEGELLHGFPYAMPDASPVFVSMAALGPPYPRVIVAVGGDKARFIGTRGQQIQNVFGWNFGTALPIGPWAAGDVDLDGSTELVGTMSDRLFVIDRLNAVTELSLTLPAAPSNTVSLADVDRDGDLEIAVPLSDGTLYLYDHDGTVHAGWPYTSATGAPLSAVAVANCLGTSSLELAVASQNWTVHLLYETGVEQFGYPVTGNGWYMYGSPIMDMLADPNSADVIIGARGAKGWAWDNGSNLVDGWPKAMDDHVAVSPASGDVDLDGSLELVMISQSQVHLIDVNQTPGSNLKAWSMYAHDGRRTGCQDCPEDLVTGVEDEDRVTMVSFAGASPNPVSSGGTVFRFALPARASVELAVYDVRGRRVRLVGREEMEAGEHLLAWDGRGDDGRALSSGHYVANLRVRGPGLRNELTRKVTVLR